MAGNAALDRPREPVRPWIRRERLANYTEVILLITMGVLTVLVIFLGAIKPLVNP